MSRVTYSGFRNGFPFALPAYAGIPDPWDYENKTWFPVSMPIHDASKMFWRVRKWSLEAEWKDTYGSTTRSQSTILVQSSSNNPAYALTNEAQLIRWNGLFAAESQSISGTTPSLAARMEITGTSAARGTRDGSGVRLGFGVSIQAGIGNVPLSSSQYDQGFGTPYLQTNIACTVMGYSVDIYHLDDYDYLSGGYTGTITITPHKYWTYDGLYDEDTGEPV